MDNIFQARFNELTANMSMRKIGEKCGFSDITAKNYIDGKTSPDLTKVVSIAKAFDVSPSWLLGFSDEKRATVAPSEKTIVNKSKEIGIKNGRQMPFLKSSNDFDWSDYVPIPIYDIEVSAGSGAFVNGENVIGYKPFLESELRAHGLNPTTLGLATITSDSMTPTLEPKDRILFDWSQTHADGIFIFRVENELFCKRLAREPHRVKVISDNKQYDTFELTDKDNFEVLARVVWDGGYLL